VSGAGPSGSDAAPSDGPLQGVRVLELGSLLAGPFAGRLLGDLGADVTKVEAPGKPDPLRDWGIAEREGRPLWWSVLARNKKCITLDLRQTEGQELLLELARRADVVIENFRPGTLERWNLGWDRLSAANPGLVLCRISGYGQDGRYGNRAGYASVAEAFSGLRYLNGFPGGPPPRIGLSLGDSLGSLFAVQGILAALVRRNADPEQRGQVIDVALVDACFALLESVVPEYDRFSAVREPSGTGIKGVAPSNIFRSRDGTWMVIAANQDTVFERLCTAIGRPELSAEPRFCDHRARGENQEALEELIADWASEHDAREIDELLNDAGVVCGPVNTIADVFAHPYFHERELLLEHEDAQLGRFVGPGIVPRFSDSPGRVRWTGPLEPGAHNSELYGELGLDEAALDDLRKRGVI
jgi:formyl-CoA transferase